MNIYSSTNNIIHRASKTFGEYNSDSYGQTVLLTNDGTCSLTYAQFFKSTCEIDVGDFPFDEQTCDMTFGSWSMDSRLLKLRSQNSHAISEELYKQNGEWTLDSAVLSSDNVSYILKFGFVIIIYFLDNLINT